MGAIERNLEENFSAFHKAIDRHFARVWKSEFFDKKRDEEKARKALLTPGKTLKRVSDGYRLHLGSIRGTYLEWVFFHFLNAGLVYFKKDKIAEVIHRYPILHPDEKRIKGTSKLHLDLVIKKRDSTKVFYAFEIKTNLDDGFAKYRNEEKMLYPRWRKEFGGFKYFYICANKAGIRVFKRDVNALRRRGEIFCFGQDSELPGAVYLLCAMKKAIQGIK